MADTTRSSLLRRIKDTADAAAWTEFDAIYRPMLHRFATAWGLDAADSEDIAQRCMTAVHAHIKGFKYEPHKGKFKSWLRTLANNEVRSALRKRRIDQARTDDLRRIEGREQSPEALFEQIWLREHLRHCLDRIRTEVEAPTIDAFQRYVIEQQPIEQVCDVLNMTTNQVHLIKWRIVTKLRKRLAELLDGSGVLDE